MRDPKCGAYSEPFGLCFPKAMTENNGTFYHPWRKFGSLPEEIEVGRNRENCGGTGLALRFVEWCERETGREL